MKKLLFIFTVVLAATLQAELGKDQFTQISFPSTQTYGKALEICKEKGFSHFLIKKISYLDERGQTLEFKGVSKAEGGTLITETITQEFGPPLGTIKFDFELLCFKEVPKDILAIDVQGVFDFVSSIQNQQPEKEVVGSCVREVNNMEELKAEIAKAKGPIYLDCYSSHCPPCKILAPKFDQYSKDFSSKGTFLKINLDKVPEISAQYKLTFIPTIIVFKDQKEVERKTALPEILKYFESLR